MSIKQLDSADDAQYARPPALATAAYDGDAARALLQQKPLTNAPLKLSFTTSKLHYKQGSAYAIRCHARNQQLFSIIIG